MHGGGTVLGVSHARPGRRETLATLADVAALGGRGSDRRSGDVMLGEIAFDHPLFAPLAAPSSTTSPRSTSGNTGGSEPDALGEARVSWPGSRMATRPSIEKTFGKGRLVVLTSGWSPADSQLARSSKFVPLMSGLLEGRNARPLDAASHQVRDRRAVPRHPMEPSRRPQAGRDDDQRPRGRDVSPRPTSPASTRSTRPDGARDRSP